MNYSLDKLSEKLIPLDAPVKTLAGYKLGAVLVPICYTKHSILFSKRSNKLKDHPGQISFPGGHVEKTDNNIVDACLRETYEEVGIQQEYVKIMGRLSPQKTTSNFFVYPIVGLIEPKAEIVINPSEVEKVFFASIEDLMDNSKQSLVKYQGKKHVHYHVNGYTIWGVTSIMLTELLSLIKSED